MTQEKIVRPQSGYGALAVCLGLLLVTPVLILLATGMEGRPAVQVGTVVIGIISGLIGLVCLFGMVAIAPNDARVFLLFGEYIGTAKDSGFYWVNPFYSKNISRSACAISKQDPRVSRQPMMRPARSWKNNRVQSVVRRKSTTETAIQSTFRPWSFGKSSIRPKRSLKLTITKTLWGSRAKQLCAVWPAVIRMTAKITKPPPRQHRCDLRSTAQRHSGQVAQSGGGSYRSSLKSLAYSAEIAAAMLQRQQAHAVVAARTKIVEGAVGMVEMALERLADGKMVQLDDERRAHMVSNLLVVLCSDRHTQPVINTGSHS